MDPFKRGTIIIIIILIFMFLLGCNKHETLLSKTELEKIALVDANKQLNNIEMKINISIPEDLYINKSTNQKWDKVWKIRLDTLDGEPLLMYYIDRRNGNILENSMFIKAVELKN